MLLIKNLYKSFGDLKVLNDIDFKVEKGERVVIVGPSGSGKSTFLRCINLLETPTKGEIIFEGKSVNKTNTMELRKKIGMLFQSFNLFSNLTVLENLTLAPVKTKLMSKEEAHEKAIEYLNMISLLDKKDEYPQNLSGGQKQRVAIIRSLMMNPDILLVDEPTSALDSEMIKEVLNLLKKVADDGMTMIIVSHELDFAKEIGTKIVFMDQGRIVESGTPQEIFENPKTSRLKEFLSVIN
jgi:polar amino acid transport system ATP-binding protein